MTDVEGIGNIPTGLFADALAAGEEIEVLGELQMWVFFASFQGGPTRPRLALGIQTWENANPSRTHVRALVLTEPMLVKLIAAAQQQLQRMQVTGPPGDGDESR